MKLYLRLERCLHSQLWRKVKWVPGRVTSSVVTRMLLAKSCPRIRIHRSTNSAFRYLGERLHQEAWRSIGRSDTHSLRKRTPSRLSTAIHCYCSGDTRGPSIIFGECPCLWPNLSYRLDHIAVRLLPYWTHAYLVHIPGPLLALRLPVGARLADVSVKICQCLGTHHFLSLFVPMLHHSLSRPIDVFIVVNV